ncbi:hypothetical protein C0Q70_01666 [Pomacea canaliculata]|uniref:Uncharacterized protein n=1 Tax=Pomacea canaliculata TaxID=400727 RepID=A0A2T7Q045_POMCA|nr:hypothetical protein C0Q70_01666 [Pomacea canaliculata]
MKQLGPLNIITEDSMDSIQLRHDNRRDLTLLLRQVEWSKPRGAWGGDAAEECCNKAAAVRQTSRLLVHGGEITGTACDIFISDAVSIDRKSSAAERTWHISLRSSAGSTSATLHGRCRSCFQQE